MRDTALRENLELSTDQWSWTVVSGEKAHMHEQNMQTPHSWELKLPLD